MEQAVIYNHIAGLPLRALLASLSCPENAASNVISARLFCWKTSPTTLSLQVTWKQEKRHCMKGRWVTHPGMAFAWDACQHSSTAATGHCLMTISHEVWLGGFTQAT